MTNMERALSLLLLGIIWSATAITAFSQATVQGVQVQLSLAEEKTIYRTGEPIRLTLSFTADGQGYQLNTTTTKPASPVDEVLLSPDAGVFHWLDEYSSGNRYYPDYSSSVTLSSTPTRVELPLGDWFRFDRPGKYTVRVKTRRASKPARATDFSPPLPLMTNEVSFEVKAMSKREEEGEVQRLAALLDATRNWQEEANITEELSYLAGDASTREKVRRFLDSGGRSGNYFQNIYFGLFIARDRALVVRLLESALRDPNTGVTHGLLTTLTGLRVRQEYSDAQRAANVRRREGESQEQRRSSEIEQGYVRELVASLPKRAGKSRATTAMTILAHLPKEKAEAALVLKGVREILLQEFDNLHPFDQEYLLRVYWEQLRDASLVPALERMLKKNHAAQGYLIRASALKRLMELNPEGARPFVVAEVSDPGSVVDFDVLRALDDATLPETDTALLAQIRALAPLRRNGDFVLLRHKALLAARYATPAVYDGLMEAYQTWSAKWQADARGSLLGYFARYNEAQAMPLIEQALAGLQPGQDSSFLLDLTRSNYPEAVDTLLRKRLESDEPEVVSSAAYVMSQRGPAEGKELIRARLERWLSEWRGRIAELEATGADAQMMAQRMVQVNLIEALMLGKSWKLPEAEAKQLQQSCITQTCRQHFRVR